MSKTPNTISIESYIAKLPALRKNSATTQLVDSIKSIVNAHLKSIEIASSELHKFSEFVYHLRIRLNEIIVSFFCLMR